ncbi:MAG: transglutaminaseTgpA domain-containing protein [Acidimicrobiales bacterium]
MGLAAVVMERRRPPRPRGIGATAHRHHRADTGPRTCSVVSPLVQVAASLVEQSDEVLFTVEVPREQRDYWRLMALTSYEDEIWRRSSNFDAIRGPVGSTVAPAIARREVVQKITSVSPGNIYPAAYEVSAVVDDGGIDLEYELAAGAPVVARGLDRIPRGFSYEIISSAPVVDATTSRPTPPTADGRFPEWRTPSSPIRAGRASVLATRAAGPTPSPPRRSGSSRTPAPTTRGPSPCRTTSSTPVGSPTTSRSPPRGP